MIQLTDKDIARFWSHVDKSGNCWTWTGARNHDGYGRFQLHGNIYNASRVSWVIVHGAIPPRYCICHTCDNPPCIRPDHLFLGTRSDNGRDMVSKGRATYAKLQPHQIPEIRQLRLLGWSLKAIANRFGVSLSMVSMIINRISWRDIPD